MVCLLSRTFCYPKIVFIAGFNFDGRDSNRWIGKLEPGVDLCVVVEKKNFDVLRRFQAELDVVSVVRPQPANDSLFLQFYSRRKRFPSNISGTGWVFGILKVA